MKHTIAVTVDGLDDATLNDATKVAALGAASQQAGDAAVRAVAAVYPDRLAAGDITVTFTPAVTITVMPADLEPQP